jgi:hypothetical protein
MSVFSTRNSDGASGLGEPVNTIPAADRRGMQKQARRHGCNTLAELYTAGPNRPDEFDPAKADRN